MKKDSTGPKIFGDRRDGKLALSRETVRVLTSQHLSLVAAGMCVTPSDDTEVPTQVASPICE
jgi:hypothetical protein